MNIDQLAKSFDLTLRRNSPTILTGCAVAGLITTVIFAVRVTPKALYLIEKEEERRQLEYGSRRTDLTTFDIVKVTWRCYIPTLGLGLSSICCMVGANSINLRRNAALASIYGLTEAAFKEYRSKVVETFGANKDIKLRDEICADHVTADPPNPGKVILTGYGNTLCYDVISGRYFKSDIERLKKATNELNHRMLEDGYVSLNDFYYEIRLENISIGEDLGWAAADGLIDLWFGSKLTEDGTPCLIFDFRDKMAPRYDYQNR